MQHYVFDSPIGRLAFHVSQDEILSVDFASRLPVSKKSDDLLYKLIHKQLDAYFSHKQHHLDLPFKLNGTEHQRKVWKKLRAIPFGKTMTYGQIASSLNSSAQAVGNACRQNPVPLIVPCHRVVAKQGPGGFAGKTTGKPVQRKTWLLQHEGAI